MEYRIDYNIVSKSYEQRHNFIREAKRMLDERKSLRNTKQDDKK